MAKKKKSTPPAANVAEPVAPAPPAPAEASTPAPITLTLIDANQPKSGMFSWVLGNNVVNSSLAGLRFDYIADSAGRFISVNDSENLYGNPLHGMTITCDAQQAPQSFYLTDSPTGIMGFQRSPSPNDVEQRATISPGLFKALLDSQLVATTGKALIQHDAATGNAVELTVPRSPIEGLCHSPVIKAAIQKNSEIKR